MPQHAFPARSYARAIIMLFIACLSSSAEVTLKSDDTVQVVVKGFGALQNGQIVSGHYASQTAGSSVKMDHLWLQKGFVNLGTAITYHQRLQVALELEGKIWRDEAYSNYLEMWEIPEKKYSFCIPRAEAEYAFPDIGPLSVRLGMGIFPYKYKSDVRNLGEYLFRTRTYPNLIKNEFDMPYARCTGVKLQTELAGILFQDILFTSETDLRPVYAFSLTFFFRDPGLSCPAASHGMLSGSFPAVSREAGKPDTNRSHLLGDAPRKICRNDAAELEPGNHVD